MGLFDSYYLPWADQSAEVQTKEFDPLMRGWSFGSRVPVEDAASDAPDLWILPEGFSLESRWGVEGQSRLALLAHWEGLFCDAAVIADEERAPFAERCLRELWENPAWRSEGLSLLLDLSRQQIAHQSELARAQTTLGRAWLSELEARQARASGAPLSPLLSFGLNLDFKEKPLEARWSEIFSGATPASLAPLAPHWRAACSPPPPAPPPAIDPRLVGGWGGSDPELPRLRRRPELADLPSARAALISSLRFGRLDRAASAVEQWPALASDPAARAELEAWLPKACVSTLFCQGAARLMAAAGVFPEIRPDQGPGVPAIEWLASMSGAPSGAIEALLQAEAPASEALLFHLLRRDYLPLLPLALGARSPNAPRDAQGRSLLDAAVALCSPSALRSVLELGADPLSLGPDGLPSAMAAFELARRRPGGGAAGLPGAPLSDEELCAQALIERGAIEALDALPGGLGGRARALLTPALAAAFAQSERQGLSQAVETAGARAPVDPLGPPVSSGAARVAPRSL